MMADIEERRVSPEAAELRRIRDRLVSLGGAEWLMSSDGETTRIEARTGDDLNEIAWFMPDASVDDIDFFANAPHMVSFLLGLVDRAIAAARKGGTRHQGQGRASDKDYAAEAAMKCEEPAFRVFLEERHGLERPLTPERVAQRLRSVLGVRSRKQLNDNSAAADRWRSLRADYDAWRRAGQ